MNEVHISGSAYPVYTVNYYKRDQEETIMRVKLGVYTVCFIIVISLFSLSSTPAHGNPAAAATLQPNSVIAVFGTDGINPEIATTSSQDGDFTINAIPLAQFPLGVLFDVTPSDGFKVITVIAGAQSTIRCYRDLRVQAQLGGDWQVYSVPRERAAFELSLLGANGNVIGIPDSESGLHCIVDMIRNKASYLIAVSKKLDTGTAEATANANQKFQDKEQLAKEYNKLVIREMVAQGNPRVCGATTRPAIYWLIRLADDSSKVIYEQHAINFLTGDKFPPTPELCATEPS